MATEDKNISRRNFLKGTGVAAGLLLSGGAGGLIGYNLKKTPAATPAHNQGAHDNMAAMSPKGLKFFQNIQDFKTLAQATERIFPQDDAGPGAIGLGVPYFIDSQLAGDYGSNVREYMKGPFYKGEPTQGFQSHLSRAAIYMQGIATLNEEAQKRFKKGFLDIAGDQMDEILSDLEKDKVKMVGVQSSYFFKLLRNATLEGAFSDPIYGGNADMQGWKMKGFPGHQMTYASLIDKADFQNIKPMSLADMSH